MTAPGQEALDQMLKGKKLILEGNAEGLPEKRIAVVGSFSLDYLPPLLTSALLPLGVYPKITLGGFNQWVQDILDKDSWLYQARPEAVVLVTALEDLFGEWYAGPNLPAARQAALVKQQLKRFSQLIDRLAKNLPAAAVYLVIPALDRLPNEAVVGAHNPFRGQKALESFLSGLRELAAKRPSLICVDWDLHLRRRGGAAFSDDRLWYTARMRLNIPGCHALAELVAYYYGVVSAPRVKVVVTDLDNTAWGGIVSEEGWQSLVLGNEGVGLAFQDYQRELLRLRDAGLLLAICSKNDEKAVWDAFEKHPGMALKKKDFSVWRINWSDKTDNILAIAKELNLGVDSLLFIDDDPVQRAEIRTRLKANVPELPKDPCRRPRFMRELSALHRMDLTKEDRKRSKMYEERARRERAKSSAVSLEEFLRSLEQEARIDPVDAANSPRAAQMCQKTNQFNLTTRRYGVADFEAMRKDPETEAYALSLRDKFGDNGVVGVGVLKFDAKNAEIDSFLLSCRVLGRKVEDALLSFLAGRARARGVTGLLGRHIPTERNAQTKDFFSRRGFEPAGGPGLFRLDLVRQTVPFPDEIKLAA